MVKTGWWRGEMGRDGAGCDADGDGWDDAIGIEWNVSREQIVLTSMLTIGYKPGPSRKHAGG